MCQSIRFNWIRGNEHEAVRFDSRRLALSLAYRTREKRTSKQEENAGKEKKREERKRKPVNPEKEENDSVVCPICFRDIFFLDDIVICCRKFATIVVTVCCYTRPRQPPPLPPSPSPALSRDLHCATSLPSPAAVASPSSATVQQHFSRLRFSSDLDFHLLGIVGFSLSNHTSECLRLSNICISCILST